MKSRYFVLVLSLVLLRLYLYDFNILIPNQLLLGSHSLKTSICKEPKYAFDKQTLILCPQGLNYRIIAYTETFPRYSLYDQLNLSCFLQKPAILTDFDYPQYLAKQGVFLVCYYPQIINRQEFEANNFKYQWWQWSEKLALKIDKHLPEPQAGLAKALVLGRRGEIWPKLVDNLNQAGLAHILAVSGLHISILAGLLLRVLSKFKYKRVCLLIFLLAYLGLLGFSVAASRAVLMTILVFANWQNLRLRIFLAASLMLIWQPRFIAEVSFQLSFLALLGISEIYPLLSNYLNRNITRVFLYFRMKKTIAYDTIWSPRMFLYQVAQVLLLSLAVNIALGPLLLYYFGYYNLYSSLINIIVLPLLPFILTCLYLAILMPIFTGPIFWLANLLLSLLVFVSHWPFGYVEYRLSLPAVLIYYFVLLIWLFWQQKNRSNKPIFLHQVI